jgi:type I site-specific restriction endonuclease
METPMSTLTQSSLEAAMSKLRADTESSIEKLRKELQSEVKSMEEKIANAVVAAIRVNPPMDSMETEYADAISMQSSQTAATIQTLADKYDSLHNAMMLLTERVSELAEIQTQAQNKRNRPLDTPPKFRLPPATDSPKNAQQSPPTKVPRAERVDRPTTPPPNGTPRDGAQEGH